MKLKSAIDGFFTGMILQLALGPLFFYIVGIAINSNFKTAFAAIIAVVVVDYIYIILSIAGIGAILEKEKIKKVVSIISSIILLIFGIYFIYNALFSTINISNDNYSISIIGTFTTAFILTISSPLTIIFWSSIFTTKSVEKGYKKSELLFFGLAAGFATLLFLTLAVYIISLFRSNIPLIVITILNIIVGSLISIYGVVRLFKGLQKIKTTC